jgi:hypothetical protein
VTVGGNLQVSAGYQPPNSFPTLTTATIDGSTGYGVSITLPVTVDTQMVAVAVAGAKGNNFALGASLSLSFIRQTIKALLEVEWVKKHWKRLNH